MLAGGSAHCVTVRSPEAQEDGRGSSNEMGWEQKLPKAPHYHQHCVLCIQSNNISNNISKVISPVVKKAICRVFNTDSNSVGDELLTSSVGNVKSHQKTVDHGEMCVCLFFWPIESVF